MGTQNLSGLTPPAGHVTSMFLCWLPEGVIPYRDSRPDEGPGSCNFVFLLLNSLVNYLNHLTKLDHVTIMRAGG